MGEKNPLDSLFDGIATDEEMDITEDPLFSNTMPEDVYKKEKQAQNNHMRGGASGTTGTTGNYRGPERGSSRGPQQGPQQAGPRRGTNTSSPYNREEPKSRFNMDDPNERMEAMGMSTNKKNNEGKSNSPNNDTDGRLNDYDTGRKNSLLVGLIAGALAIFLSKDKVNGIVGNLPFNKNKNEGESKEPVPRGRGRGSARGPQATAPEKMTWGQRLAMIIVAMVGLFAVLSFATFMINTITNRDSNPTVDGFQEIVQNIHKGGTIEGINNPNKKVWTVEERKAFPYEFENQTYIKVKNEDGAIDYYTYTELEGYHKDDIPEFGYVWVRYVIDNETKDVLKVELDGLVDEEDPYNDNKIIKGEDGEIIDIKKDKLRNSPKESKKLTQSEYEALSETDKQLYNLKIAEESLDIKVAEEEMKTATKIKNKVVDIKDKIVKKVYNIMGKEYKSKKELKPKRRQFKINPLNEDGTRKTKEEINKEINDIKEGISE